MNRSLTIAAASALALLTFTGPGAAAAAGGSAPAASPTIEHQVPFSGAFDDGGETCGGFGVIFTYSGERTYIDFYAPDGTLLKEIRQITFTGTLTNDVTDASIPYAGRFVRTYDATTNTITTTGLNTTLNGVAVTAGRSVFDLDTGAGTEVGKDQFGPDVCAALS